MARYTLKILTLVLFVSTACDRIHRPPVPLQEVDSTEDAADTPLPTLDPVSIPLPEMTSSPEPTPETPSTLKWIGSVDPKKSAEIPFGLLDLTRGQPSLLISRPQYLLSWNASTRLVNWASWVLVKDNIGSARRSENFYQDAELEKALAASSMQAVKPSDFNGSCFDRGHQVPSKDRTDNEVDNTSTFQMSNVVPQTAYMNRVVWERLEAYTRDRIEREPEAKIWILTGPIFTSPKLRFMGPAKNIAIPDANFKIIVDLGADTQTKAQLIAAVIVPNLTSKGTDPVADHATACSEGRGLKVGALEDSKNWMSFQVDLGRIETEAHVDLSLLKSQL